MNSALLFMFAGLFLIWAIATGRAKSFYLAWTQPQG